MLQHGVRGDRGGLRLAELELGEVRHPGVVGPLLGGHAAAASEFI